MARKFICMEAVTFKKQHGFHYPVFMQPKWDGVRGLFNHPNNLDKFTSKQDFLIEGVPELVARLKELQKETGSLYHLDGEIIVPALTFNQTNGLVRRKKNNLHPAQETAQYHIFDILIFNANYARRLARLKDWYDKVPASYKHLIKIIETKSAIDRVQAENLYKEFSEFSEGAVYKNPEAFYEIGKSKNFVKRKPWKYMQCNVVELYEGEKRLEGTLGGITVCSSDDTSKVFNVGGGFSDAERDRIWANPPLKGTTLIIKYQELSEYGIPRFLSFKEWV